MLIDKALLTAVAVLVKQAISPTVVEEEGQPVLCYELESLNLWENNDGVHMALALFDLVLLVHPSGHVQTDEGDTNANLTLLAQDYLTFLARSLPRLNA